VIPIEKVLEGIRIPTRLEVFSLAALALEIAVQEEERSVREVETNDSERIREYWLAIDPPLDIRGLKQRPPWCAVFVQYCWDVAARLLHVPNPLDEVALEAYVPSYVELAQRRGWVVPIQEALPGDLVAFSFGGARFDHIGLVRLAPAHSPVFYTVEGNTPGVATGDQTGKSARAVDGVHTKKRRSHIADPCFIRPRHPRAA